MHHSSRLITILQSSACLPAILFFCLALPLVVLAEVSSQERQATGSRPNVVIFYVDDLGYGDLGAYGNTRASTPNLDRMAAEGVRFTEFYAPSALCTPSRAGLITGRYPVRYGMAHNVLYPSAETGLPAGEITLPELLHPAGYRSGLFGKWHLGHTRRYLPLQQGFDEFNGTPFSNDMAVNVRFEGNRIVDFDPDQGQFTRLFTEAAIEFIERNREHPFLVLITPPMPHVPLYVSPAFEDSTGQGIYADVVAEIDWSVGQLRSALERLGLSDETFVLFASDNGPWLEYAAHGGSSGHLRAGKNTTFEGGQRVPAIAVWPGKIDPGRVQSGVITGLDVFPTLAAWAGLALPADRPVDGQDMSALILGDGGFPEERTFGYFAHGRLQALRIGDWKIKRPRGPNRAEWLDMGWPGTFPAHDWLLFNLAKDPGETVDLASRFPLRTQWMKLQLKFFPADLEPLAPTMKMGSGEEGYTADLEGARPPRHTSGDYQAEAMFACRKYLQERPGEKCPL